MALKIKELNDFAKTIGWTQANIKYLYIALSYVHPANKLTIDFLSKHIKGVMSYSDTVRTTKEILESYIEDGLHKHDFEPKKPQMSKEEIQDQLHKDMNAKVHDNERIKLGYSKRQWAEIKRFEKIMVDYLQIAVPKFAEEMVVQQLTADDDKAVELFLNMEKKWKDFCRKHIINRYPGSDKNGKVRDNILKLFADKVSSFLGRKK
jgi:hypothetical protein